MGTPDNECRFDSKAEAQILFQQARDLIENSDPPKGDLGWMDKMNCKNALPLLEMAVSLDPESADMRFGLGSALKTLGSNQWALHHLKKTLATQPDMIIARMCAINLLIKIGKYGEAFPLTKEGTNLHPKESIIWYSHAHCCMVVKKFEEALQSAKMALNTAKEEDLKPTSQFKNSIVTMMHQARQALNSQPTVIKPGPQPG